MPFQIDGKDDRSKEEMKLFHQMAATYKRRAASSSQHGYHAFANAWNMEAGRRRTAYISGDENVNCDTFKECEDAARLLR